MQYNRRRRRRGRKFDWERAAQGAVSGASYGSSFGPKGTIAGAIVGGFSGGMTGRDDSIDRAAYEDAVRLYADDRREGARIAGDELSAQTSAALHSRGVSGELATGIISANRGRLMRGAERDIANYKGDVYLRLADAERQTQTAYDTATAQGWLQLAEQLGLQALLDGRTDDDTTDGGTTGDDTGQEAGTSGGATSTETQRQEIEQEELPANETDAQGRPRARSPIQRRRGRSMRPPEPETEDVPFQEIDTGSTQRSAQRGTSEVSGTQQASPGTQRKSVLEFVMPPEDMEAIRTVFPDLDDILGVETPTMSEVELQPSEPASEFAAALEREASQEGGQTQVQPQETATATEPVFFTPEQLTEMDTRALFNLRDVYVSQRDRNPHGNINRIIEQIREINEELAARPAEDSEYEMGNVVGDAYEEYQEATALIWDESYLQSLSVDELLDLENTLRDKILDYVGRPEAAAYRNRLERQLEVVEAVREQKIAQGTKPKPGFDGELGEAPEATQRPPIGSRRTPEVDVPAETRPQPGFSGEADEAPTPKRRPIRRRDPITAETPRETEREAAPETRSSQARRPRVRFDSYGLDEAPPETQRRPIRGRDPVTAVTPRETPQQTTPQQQVTPETDTLTQKFDSIPEQADVTYKGKTWRVIGNVEYQGERVIVLQRRDFFKGEITEEVRGTQINDVEIYALPPKPESEPESLKVDLVPPPAERRGKPKPIGEAGASPGEYPITSEWVDDTKMKDLPDWFAYIYADEAGYNASDPSYAGITQSTYDGWSNKPEGAPTDVKELAKHPEIVNAFYKWYTGRIRMPKELKGNPGAEYMYVDIAIHAGFSGARRIYRNAMSKLQKEGVTSPTTEQFLRAFDEAKREHYGDNTGWLNRAGRVLDRALAMSAGE